MKTTDEIFASAPTLIIQDVQLVLKATITQAKEGAVFMLFHFWIFSICAPMLSGCILFAPHRSTCHIFT